MIENDTPELFKQIVSFANTLGHQKEITRSDVEGVLGIGSTYAINLLKEMQENNLIKKLGNGKKT